VVAPPIQLEAIAGGDDHERAPAVPFAIQPGGDRLRREHELLPDADVRCVMTDAGDVKGQ
jgi:hypothetical protein